MTVVLLLLLFGAPGYTFWRLVPGVDPIGRLVVASVASPVVVSGVAMVMLILGAWSPLGGFLAVLAISGLLAFAARYRHRRFQLPARPGPGHPIRLWPADPSSGTADAARSDDSPDTDNWIYEP